MSFKYPNTYNTKNRKEHIKALEKFKGGTDHVQVGWEGAGITKSFMKWALKGK